MLLWQPTFIYMATALRIPAIHNVRTDMTHFKSNARLLIMSMACNVICYIGLSWTNIWKYPKNAIFLAHFRIMYSRYP